MWNKDTFHIEEMWKMYLHTEGLIERAARRKL